MHKECIYCMVFGCGQVWGQPRTVHNRYVGVSHKNKAQAVEAGRVQIVQGDVADLP